MGKILRMNKKVEKINFDLSNYVQIFYDSTNNTLTTSNTIKKGFGQDKFEKHLKDFYTSEKQFDKRVSVPDTKDKMKKLLKDEYKKESTEFWADIDDNDIKGFIKFSKIEDDTKFGVNRLYVNPKYRKQNVGTNLLKIAEERAYQMNFNEMFVGVMDKNFGAQAFYKKIGFVFNDESTEYLENIQSNEEYIVKHSKKKYRYNNAKSVKRRRSFKCMDCGQRFGEFDLLVKHAQKFHKDLIGNEDIYKYLYEKRNPGPYICTICHKRPRVWNDKSHKYSRICDNPECAKKAREIFSKNMKKVYGTDNLAADPEYQAALLANRSISGVFTFPNKETINYTGKYEEDFLETCVKELNWTSDDIKPVPASLYVEYFDFITQKKRIYIPDFFIPKYNLVIEIKDASKYPVDSKQKALMKEKAVIALNKFNYIKIVEKDYTDFFNFIKSFEENHFSDTKRDKEFIFIIPETNEKI